MTVQHIVDSGESFESHAADLAGPYEKKVLLRQANTLRKFFRPDSACREHDIEGKDNTQRLENVSLLVS